MNRKYLVASIIASVCCLSSVSFAADPAPVLPPAWHGDAALGLSLAKGNSDTLLLSGSAMTHKEWSRNELRLGIDGQYGVNNFGRTNEVRTADSLHGFIDYKRLFTNNRLYGSARIDGLYDAVADVHYRVIVGPSLGYYFIKSTNTLLSAEAGPSFVQERVGDAPSDNHWTLRLSERAEHKFLMGAKVWEQVDFLPSVDNFKDYLMKAEVGVEAAINAHLSLRVVAIDQYNSNPAASRKPNDILLISSIVYKY